MYFAQIFVAVKIFRVSEKDGLKLSVKEINRVRVSFHVTCNFSTTECLLAPYTGV
jgi:hypothetical protein